MSIIWCGGEMGAFIPADSLATEITTSFHFNSSFSRCGVTAGTSSSFETPAFAAQTDFYIHVCLSNGFFASGSTTPMLLVDGSDVEQVKITYNRGTDELTLAYWNGASYTTVDTISVSLEQVTQDTDIYVKCNTASGQLKLYIAGTLRIDSGVIDLSGAASIVKVRCLGAGASPVLSQLIVADEPTIGWRLVTRYPNGAGSDSAWTGTYTGVDETVYSDADFINSATANQVSMFTQTGDALTGYVVRAVAVTARAKKGASGPANLQLAIRSSGTNYFSSSNALDVGYGGFCNIWETDPATAADWVNTAADAIQIGVKSIT